MAFDEDIHDPREFDSWLLATGWSREAWEHCRSPQERIETGLGPTVRQDPLLQVLGSRTFQPTVSEAENTQMSQSSWSAGVRSPTVTTCRVAVPGPSADQAWT